MSRLVILKNGRPLPVRAGNAAEARDIIEQEIRRAPTATFEIARLLRRFTADVIERRIERKEEDLEAGGGGGRP